MRLDHHKLEVYGLVRLLRRQVHELTLGLPRGHADLLDQLNRAALSIRLNIAEGSAEYSPKEKARLYRIARRSGTEVSAVLDDLEDLGVITASHVAPAQELLARIVGALVRLIQSAENTPPRPPTPTPKPKPKPKPASASSPTRGRKPTPTPTPYAPRP